MILCVVFDYTHLSLTMAAFTTMTFNLDSEHDYRDWSRTVCDDIVSCVSCNGPDIVGFQMADSNISQDDDEETKQTDLADELDDMGLVLVMFDDNTAEPYISDPDEIVQAAQNKNPIAFNNLRYSLVAHGTDLIKWTDELNAPEWGDFRDLNMYFRGVDTTGDGFGDSVSRFDPIVYANWIVVKDMIAERRVVVTNTHYNIASITNPFVGNEAAAKWTRYDSYCNRVAAHTTKLLVSRSIQLRREYGASATVVLGDFGIGNSGSSLLTPFSDNYFIDAWHYVDRKGGPWSTYMWDDGVSHIFNSTDLDVQKCFYDWVTASDASDYTPLIAHLVFTDIAEEEADVEVEGEVNEGDSDDESQTE